MSKNLNLAWSATMFHPLELKSLYTPAYNLLATI